MPKHDQWYRRTVTKLGLMTMVGTAMNRTAAAAEEGWIDAHVHVWTPDVQRYPLSDGFEPSSMNPPSFTPDELMSHCRPAGVERIVLIQMSFYRFDNRYMLDVIADNPSRFSGVAIVDHHDAMVAHRMEELSKQGVRGLRVTGGKEGVASWLRDEGMGVLWRKAPEFRLAVCPLINPQDLSHIDAMCQRHPETTVVIDHFARVGMGGPVDPVQLDALCRLARFPNVYVKTSAFYAVGGEPPYDKVIPTLRRVIEAFGVERLMWASDAPFQVQPPHTYEKSIAVIRDRMSDLSSSDRRWLLRQTAEKVFFNR